MRPSAAANRRNGVQRNRGDTKRWFSPVCARSLCVWAHFGHRRTEGSNSRSRPSVAEITTLSLFSLPGGRYYESDILLRARVNLRARGTVLSGGQTYSSTRAYRAVAARARTARPLLGRPESGFSRSRMERRPG